MLPEPNTTQEPDGIYYHHWVIGDMKIMLATPDKDWANTTKEDYHELLQEDDEVEDLVIAAIYKLPTEVEENLNLKQPKKLTTLCINTYNDWKYYRYYDTNAGGQLEMNVGYNLENIDNYKLLKDLLPDWYNSERQHRSKSK